LSSTGSEASVQSGTAHMEHDVVTRESSVHMCFAFLVLDCAI